MSAKIVRQVREIIKADCKKRKNSFGYSAWTHHVDIVVKLSLKLAKKIKADKEIVELAALMHDWAGIKDKKFYKEHHVHSARLAEELLIKLKYPKDRIERVKKCIYSHRASIKIARKSKEEKCLASADAMSHITELVDLLFLAFGVHRFKTNEGAEFVLNKINRSWNKLMPEAKIIVKKDYRLAVAILKKAIKY